MRTRMGTERAREKLLELITLGLDMVKEIEDAETFAAESMLDAARLENELEALRGHQEAAEKAYGQVAALEHTVGDLKIANERLKNEADASSIEYRNMTEKVDWAQEQTAALEHTVSELEERNDRLRLKLDVLERKNRELEDRLATEPPPAVDSEAKGFPLLTKLRLVLAETQAEVEKYKTAVRVILDTVKSECAGEGCDGMWRAVKERMKKEGYDIETEEHRIEGFGDSRGQDNTEGADEHDFL